MLRKKKYIHVTLYVFMIFYFLCARAIGLFALYYLREDRFFVSFVRNSGTASTYSTLP